MAAPWEKYAAAAPAPAALAGPWAKYADTAPAASTEEQPGLVERGLRYVAENNPIKMGSDVLKSGIAAGGNLVGKITSGLVGGAEAPFTGADTAAEDVRGIQAATHTDTSSPGLTKLQSQFAPIVGAVAAPFNAAAKPIDKAINNAGPAVRTALPAASEAIQDIAGIVPVLKGARVASEAAPIVEGAAKASTATPLETARGAGYVARPSDVQARNGGTPPGLFKESVTGSAGLGKKAILQNQATTTQRAGADIGMENATKITADDIKNFRKIPGATYDATAEQLGPMAVNPDREGNLLAIAADANPATAIAPKAGQNVNRIVQRIRSGNYSGTDWRRDVSWLRANGARSAADELEGMAEDQLASSGNQPALAAYRGAREQFAKSYDIEGALDGGQVDAGKLAALDKKYPDVLTGNLKLIATAADELPGVTGLPSAGVASAGTVPHTFAGTVGKVLGAGIRKLPGMNTLEEGFQNQNFGRRMTPTEESYTGDFGRRPEPVSTEPFQPPYRGPAGLLSGPTVNVAGNGSAGLGDALADSGSTPDVRAAAAQHPGRAQPASPMTKINAAPLALPAPGATAPRSVLPPIQVSPEGEAALGDRFRDIVPPGATVNNPGVARPATPLTKLGNAPKQLPAPGQLAERPPSIVDSQGRVSAIPAELEEYLRGLDLQPGAIPAEPNNLPFGRSPQTAGEQLRRDAGAGKSPLSPSDQRALDRRTKRREGSTGPGDVLAGNVPKSKPDPLFVKRKKPGNGSEK